MSRYNYSRRKSSVAKAGNIAIGGDNPIRLQSMTNTDTADAKASADQVERIVKAGGEIVRLTTQGVRESETMAEIRKILDTKGIDVPLVADVHFNPRAAFAAAGTCEKVRINPGNFADAARTFRKLEFTDEEYATELQRIDEAVSPFYELCKVRGVCVRLGVNHGSLSDRIMSRFGDSPAGMVESVMEYLRVARKRGFDNIVISIKASNTGIMVETVRLLDREMKREEMAFPLHLGVTEAGDGEDGRIKSAIGIGALLLDGLGDTIRVSLSEDPEAELPVARRIVEFTKSVEDHRPIAEPSEIPEGNSRDRAAALPPEAKGIRFPAVTADLGEVPATWHTVDASSSPTLFEDSLPVVITSTHRHKAGELKSWIDRFVSLGGTNPIIVSLRFDTSDEEQLQVEAGMIFGSLLLSGYATGIHIVAPNFSSGTVGRLELGILQGTRLRMTKTEYISCPSCGRTLFDLRENLRKVKEATAGLMGLKIAVMGCVVNGPGEMADADYGYVGAGAGRVSIYKGKTLVEKNIPAEEALPALLRLIEADGYAVNQ